MAIEKELAYFAKFSEAPEELKQLAEFHARNYDLLETAKKNVQAWQNNLIVSEKAYFDSMKKFKAALSAWTPKSEE